MTRPNCPRLWATLALAVVLACVPGSAAAAPSRSQSLAARVLGAVRAAHFERVVDFETGGRRIAHVPNLDVAVIELDDGGGALAAADVLLSRDYPRGVSVPIDRNWGTTAVRFRRWQQQRFDGPRGWVNRPVLGRADDIVPGRDRARYRFMSPYPASLFKIMVAYEVMRQVDRGRLKLGDQLRYTGVPSSSLCGPGTQSVQAWMDAMLTWSSNQAACALLVRLQQLRAVSALNADLRNLGLGTLQVTGTRASNGANWQDGKLNMTALDTARLFWLIDGGQGALWQRPNGAPVTAGELSPASRAFLKGLLGADAFSDTLSTTVWCGRRQFGRVYPAAGIPQLAPARWIDQRGHVVVPEDNGDFGYDVRPCNAAAQVTFQHKIGLVDTAASDAGIVRSLPGQPRRHYVIAMLSNIGYRYGDPEWSRSANPCFTALGLCRSERFARLGRLIDTALTGASTARRRAAPAAPPPGQALAAPAWRPPRVPDGRP
ncbi:MAG: hypothetical protein QOK04_2408 [Solirubrobacteraceae bacterium]|jgi:hypothetical protein|nr:hypothetical protein [Solirubrobacteraceae bacterium]